MIYIFVFHTQINVTTSFRFFIILKILWISMSNINLGPIWSTTNMFNLLVLILVQYRISFHGVTANGARSSIGWCIRRSSKRHKQWHDVCAATTQQPGAGRHEWAEQESGQAATRQQHPLSLPRPWSSCHVWGESRRYYELFGFRL